LSLAQTFRPDVAIIDIGMPDLNGYEVARSCGESPGKPGSLSWRLPAGVEMTIAGKPAMRASIGTSPSRWIPKPSTES